MSQIKGTNVIAPVVPLDTADQHPSHEARYGKGGYRTVATTVERDAIPAPRREAGMLVFVTGDGKVYKLLSDLTSWEEFKSGASTWEELAGKPSTFPPSSHAASHGQGGSDEITVGVGQVAGLQSALDSKLSAADASVTNSREWSASTVTQAEAEAGTSTTRRAFTPLRVFQAIAAWWAASSAKTKLDGIATGATANATDAQLRDRSTHTGTQTASTISDFATAASAAAPVQTVAGKTGAVTLAKADVGLANVDNTADSAKPVSVAQAAADSAVASAAASDATSKANAAQAYAIQRANHTGSQAISTVAGLQDALDGKQAAGNYAPLVNNLVPSANLPSYVDDVLEYANLAAMPVTGEAGKIYVALDTGRIYRWSGSTYVEISPSPGSTDAVAEGSGNLYFTNARASAAAPVQSVAGRTGAVTIAVADVSGAVASSDARLSDSREWSADTVSQAEAEAGTATTRRAWTAQRVWQAMAAWWATVTVGTSKLADGSVTAAKLASNQNLSVTSVKAFGDLTNKPFVVNTGISDVFVVDALGFVTKGRWQGTAVAVAYGGTGATTAADARTNLGLGTLATQSGTFSGTSSGTNTGDQTITLTGDVTGSGTGTFAATLANSGVAAGTYTSVTVDAKGRVTAGSSPAVAYSSLSGVPSAFNPSAHKSSHATGGSDALTASDIGAAAASHTHTASQITDFTAAVVAAAPAYSLPTASGSVLGGVKIGSGISIDGNGVISASAGYTLPAATTTTLGGIIVGSGLAVSSGTVSVVTYAVQSDTVGSTSYIGRAVSGSATSASVWTIRRTVLTSAGAVSSTATAVNVKWDDRLTASYS